MELEINGYPSFAFSPSGQFLVAASRGELACWDATRGALRWRAVVEGHGIFAPVFAAESTRVALHMDRGSKRYALVLDARTGAFEGQVELRCTGPLALSPDGRHLAIAYAPDAVELHALS